MNAERKLRDLLRDKDDEILRFVATAYGLEDLDGLDASVRLGLQEEVEEIIEDHEEALIEGDTVEEWKALDQRLNATELGRLLQGRHEIAEQILDLRDQN